MLVIFCSVFAATDPFISNGQLIVVVVVVTAVDTCVVNAVLSPF